MIVTRQRITVTLGSFFFPHGATAPSGPGPPYCRGFTNSDTPHSSGRVIIPTQRPLPDNTQQSQETDAPVGI
jgi:hypothetical protein